MPFLLLSFVYFLPMGDTPALPLAAPISCSFESMHSDGSLGVSPVISGDGGSVGDYQITTRTMTGSNQSLAMNSGNFMLEDTEQNYSVATIRILTTSSPRVYIHMKVNSDGQASECEFIFPA